MEATERNHIKRSDHRKKSKWLGVLSYYDEMRRLLHLVPSDGYKVLSLDRKARLFCCSLLRLFWNDLRDEAKFQVEEAERYADFQISLPQLRMARGPLVQSVNDFTSFVGEGLAAKWTCYDSAITALEYIPYQILIRISRMDLACHFLREVFGLPWGYTPNLPELPQKALDFATSLYVERRFEDMPIFGDLLEDCGVTDEAILRHCRGETWSTVSRTGFCEKPVSCVRGCWMLDLVLQKQLNDSMLKKHGFPK